MHARFSISMALTALVALAACGGDSDGDRTARMNVRLVDAPADYDAVRLHVRSVEIQSDAGGWITLATPDRVVDLLTLTGGVSEALAEGATLPAGHYGQLRLVLGPDNAVVVDGEEHALKVPSGQQSGVKMTVSFDVAPGTTKDVFIDFDAHRSIFVHEAGNSEQWILRPTVRAYDKIVTGSVSGLLTDAATGAPLPGATVTAQVLDGAGAPTVVRATTTGLDGRYVLDLLPVDGTYHVVSQPVVGAVSYGAAASAPIAITVAAPTPTFDASFGVAAQVGSVAGGVSPVATESDADEVRLLQSLDAGGTPRTFVVRSTAAAVAAGVEGYALELVPAGAYSLTLTRRTIDGAGVETATTTAPVPVIVNGGATATVNLTTP